MARRRTYLTLLYLVLSVYSFGGAVVETYVYYPSWKIVGPHEFPAFHQDMGTRLIPTFVAPFFFSILVCAAMNLRPVPGLSKGLMRAALGLNLLDLAVTLSLAIPIQMALDKAQSLTEIDRLIGLDRIFRLYPGIALTVINLVLLVRLVAPAVPSMSRSQLEGNPSI